MRVPKLTEDEIAQHLPKLPGWTRQGEAITKTYQFKDFAPRDGLREPGGAGRRVGQPPPGH